MGNNINILVVDDEDVMRSLFTDILQERGFKVQTVANGQEALEKVRAAFFPIAFIDVHMPVMNGIQTLYAIREISPKTAIVMMDSFPDILLEEAEKEGAVVTCIHKPFDIREVIEVIGGIIEPKEKIA